MSKKANISISLRAEELSLDVKLLGEAVVKELQHAIGSAVKAAEAGIIAKAQTELRTTAQLYTGGVKSAKPGPNSYIIWLEGDFANKLESGFKEYSIKDRMLKSQKVVAGGRKWVKKSKAGYRYASVPLPVEKQTVAPSGTNMKDLLKKIRITNESGNSQQLTSLFKSSGGAAIEGKIASVTREMADQIKNIGGKDAAALTGVTKYQKQFLQKGKKKTAHVYVKYRTVSENPSAIAKWEHPGYKGLKAFDEAEKELLNEIDNWLKQHLS